MNNQNVTEGQKPYLMPSTDPAAWQAQLEEYLESLHEWKLLAKSGILVKAKRDVGLQELAMQGKIPDTLSGFVDASMAGKMPQMSSKNVQMLEEMYSLVMLASIVLPPLKMGDSADGMLGLNQIPLDDKQAFFEWANGEASALQTFRPETGELDPPALTRQDVQQTAKRDSQAEEPVGSVPAGHGGDDSGAAMGSGGTQESEASGQNGTVVSVVEPAALANPMSHLA